MSIIKVSIILFIIALQFNIVKANDFDTKINYFIAKKFFKEKNFDKSSFLFKNIIINNNPVNKYVKKSKIFLILINFKIKNLNKARTGIQTILKDRKMITLDPYFFYLKALVYYKFNDNYFQKIFNIKKFETEQTLQYKAFLSLKKIKKYKKFSHKIISSKKKVKSDLNLHNMHIGIYYIKRKAYIAAINRLDIKRSNLKIKRYYDYHRIFLILKSYNELFLDKVSYNILQSLKKNDFYNKSSN